MQGLTCEIKLGQIPERDDADQLAIRIDHGDGLDLGLAHRFPGLAQRHVWRQRLRRIQLQILDLDAQVTDQRWRGNFKAVENPLGLRADAACTHRNRRLADCLLVGCKSNG